MFFLCLRLNSSSRFPCRRRALRLLLFACSFFFGCRLFACWRAIQLLALASMQRRQSQQKLVRNSKTYHFVDHFSQSAGQPLGIVAHGSSPHVFGQSSKHVAAACCFGDSFQHGLHLCHPGLCKAASWTIQRARKVKTPANLNCWSFFLLLIGSFYASLYNVLAIKWHLTSILKLQPTISKICIKNLYT